MSWMLGSHWCNKSRSRSRCRCKRLLSCRRSRWCNIIRWLIKGHLQKQPKDLPSRLSASRNFTSPHRRLPWMRSSTFNNNNSNSNITTSTPSAALAKTINTSNNLNPIKQPITTNFNSTVNEVANNPCVNSSSNPQLQHLNRIKSISNTKRLLLRPKMWTLLMWAKMTNQNVRSLSLHTHVTKPGWTWRRAN